jgi:hypothetical protein
MTVETLMLPSGNHIRYLGVTAILGTRGRQIAALALAAAFMVAVLAMSAGESSGPLAGPDLQEMWNAQGRGAGPPDPPFGQDLKVGLAYVPGSPDEATTLAVYRQLLEEEGFPYEQVDARSLEGLAPQALKQKFIALILPEDVNRNVSQAFARVVERYASEAEGKTLIGYDAGTVDENGETRSQWLFSSLTGIRALSRRDGAASGEAPGSSDRYLGPWVIPPNSPLRRYYEDGVLAGDTAKIYAIPTVQEYHWRLEGVESTPLAYGQAGTASPDDAVMTSKLYAGGGAAVYINGRPGSLKVRGNNDFMMRNPLKYFLIDVARVPRIVASPGGVGGLVLSIHVCSGVYFKDLDRIFKKELLSREIPFSFSITAGPDSDFPGDGKGFDAANPQKGLPYLVKMQQHGSIGAQGGWIHNYWAYHFHELAKEEKKEYVDRNFETLSRLTGMPVTEYAAPGGMHSQDVSAFIAAQGARGASIPTSFCSPPTHGWFDAKREDRFWLFGYTGSQYGIALENMLASGRAIKDIESDLRKIIDTVVERREIRLFYSHPISIATHPEVWKVVQDYVLEKVGASQISVRTVTEFAGFLERHEKARFSTERLRDGYRIRAESTASMRDLTFALPLASGTRVADAQGFPVTEKDGWAYVTINQDLVRAEILLSTGK